MDIKINLELTATQSNFEIENITSIETPFGKQNEIYHEDFRVKYISRMLIDFENNYEYLDKLMLETMYLWSLIENKNVD